MKVLIADDSNTIRQLLTTYLKRWGYDPVSVPGGKDAWELLKHSDTPRLVILDWLMPDMDGVDICRRVRALPHGNLLYLIIFTSLEDKHNLVTALEAGADDFIAKNFDPDELLARIRVGERVVRLKSELDDRIKALEASLAHIKLLQGILPVCMGCHKIRDDKEVWQQLDQYLSEYSKALVSHGLCPDCYSKMYPEFFEHPADEAICPKAERRAVKKTE